MDKLSRLSIEDRDNLTAYLDGELDEEATRQIESLLVRSSVARNDVELLSKTYELLDELPRPGAPQDFVEKTLATAKLEQVRTPLSEQGWYQLATQVCILMLWSVCLLCVAALGSALTSRLLQNSDDTLVRELPLIRDLDRYDEVGNLEFLNRLSSERGLREEMRKGIGHEK